MYGASCGLYPQAPQIRAVTRFNSERQDQVVQLKGVTVMIVRVMPGEEKEVMKEVQEFITRIQSVISRSAKDLGHTKHNLFLEKAKWGKRVGHLVYSCGDTSASVHFRLSSRTGEESVDSLKSYIAEELAYVLGTNLTLLDYDNTFAKFSKAENLVW